jgi:hypothetical protein
MAKKVREHDFAVLARRVVEQAIGEQLNGKPLPDPNEGKDPAAIARGRLGGIKGGAARSDALTQIERIKIAKHAARARWRSKSSVPKH